MKDENKHMGMYSIKFDQAFASEEDCCRYLADVKWKDVYSCRKCGC